MPEVSKSMLILSTAFSDMPAITNSSKPGAAIEVISNDETSKMPSILSPAFSKSPLKSP